MKIAVRLILLLLLMPVAALAADVEVDWDRGIDFSRIHTFTFAPAAYSIRDPVARLDLGVAVAEEFEAKGLRLIPPEPKTYDVFVAYNAQFVSDPQDSSRQSVAITVRMFDSRNNNQIWEAGAKVLLTKDDSENRSNVRRIVTAILEKYPPR